MDRVSSFLSLRGCKFPRHKFEPLTPDYRTVSSTASSASCSNNYLTASITNLISTNIPTTANNIPHARIFNGSLALSQTLISKPIYTFSSSSSTSHFSSSYTGIEM